MVDYDNYIKSQLDEDGKPYLYYSNTAIAHKINNYPQNDVFKRNLYLLDQKIIKPLKLKYKFNVSNAFRNAKVNKLVGGKIYSAHKEGRAFDANFEYDDEEAFKNYLKSMPGIGYFYPINKETKAWHISISKTTDQYKNWIIELVKNPSILTILLIGALMLAFLS